jgi:hypothetical protein
MLLKTMIICFSNMTSFIVYVNEAFKNFLMYFTSHMHIVGQIAEIICKFHVFTQEVRHTNIKIFTIFLYIHTFLNIKI